MSLIPLAVLLGDPRLPDPTKPGMRYNPEDLDTVERLRAALASLGRYETVYLDDHTRLLADLQAAPPAFALNLCDTGFRNQPTREWHVAALLELLDIPYSGAPPAAMAACYDKGMVRAVAASGGVPVPAERYFPDASAAARAMDAFEGFPALIKPNQGDGSVGITQRALVRDAAEARAYLEWLAAALPGRAVLVQTYLSGTEYSLGLLGNPGAGFTALPLLQVDYGELPAGMPPVLCYESKAHPDSPYWNDIRYPRAGLADEGQAQLVAWATWLFARLGLRDYARFDFRADEAGRIHLLEVNPNPAWGYDGKLALMAGLHGWSYAELLGALVETARTRCGLPAAA